jgi:hypothetical protein
MCCSAHTRVLQYAMMYKFKGHVYVVAQAMLPAENQHLQQQQLTLWYAAA